MEVVQLIERNRYESISDVARTSSIFFSFLFRFFFLPLFLFLLLFQLSTRICCRELPCMFSRDKSTTLDREQRLCSHISRQNQSRFCPSLKWHHSGRNVRLNWRIFHSAISPNHCLHHNATATLLMKRDQRRSRSNKMLQPTVWSPSISILQFEEREGKEANPIRPRHSEHKTQLGFI